MDVLDRVAPCKDTLEQNTRLRRRCRRLQGWLLAPQAASPSRQRHRHRPHHPAAARMDGRRRPALHQRSREGSERINTSVVRPSQRVTLVSRPSTAGSQPSWHALVHIEQLLIRLFCRFLDSGLETALILEDDVDWDIRLRSVQIPLAASAARQLLPPPRSQHPYVNAATNHSQYWGDQDAWDLLYLGHCGDYFDIVTEDGPKTDRQSFNLTAMPHILWQDPTLPSWINLHPFTQDLFRLLGMPERTRVMHRAKFPLCSFGYAVTRRAAERLLNDLAPPKLKKSGPRAFDVALLHACNKGENTPSPTPEWQKANPLLRSKYPSPGLRCWTLNSELFHHMPGRSEIDSIGEKLGEEHSLPPVDLAAQAQVVYRNETTNIDCGFWSGAFAFDENDTDRLRFLQEKVGRQGNCLKEGKDREEMTYPPQKAMD
jgi:hypothetical protein